MTNDEKREQVAKQCEVVAALAKAMAGVHSDYANVVRSKCMDGSLDAIGDRTASFMERIGDMLNGMDASDPEDEWMNPIFRIAQATWPQSADAN